MNGSKLPRNFVAEHISDLPKSGIRAFFDRSTMGSISLHTAWEMGSIRVPSPAAGMIALVIFFIFLSSFLCDVYIFLFFIFFSCFIRYLSLFCYIFCSVFVALLLRVDLLEEAGDLRAVLDGSVLDEAKLGRYSQVERCCQMMTEHSRTFAQPFGRLL